MKLNDYSYVCFNEFGLFLCCYSDLESVDQWFDDHDNIKKIYIYEIDHYQLKSRLWDIYEK